MFKNMKIGVRLGIGFAVMVALIVTIGLIAMSKVNDINQIVNSVVKDKIPKVENVNHWVDAVNSIARTMRNGIISSDSAFIKAEFDKIAEQRDIIDKSYEYLKEKITTEEGKKVLSVPDDLRAPVRQMQDEIIDLASQNKDAEAAALLFGEYRKLQGEYLKGLAKLIEFQTVLAEKEGLDAAQMATDTTTRIVTVLIVSVLLALLIGWFIVRSITVPISRAITIADQVAEGKTDMLIVVDSTDEVGQLMNALKTMVDVLNKLVADMKNMSTQHDLGDIDVKVDSTKFQGAFKEMGEGVNGMVFGHIAVKKKAMACVAEFGKGNFDAELEKFPGKKVFINNTIEAVRTNLKSVAKELGELIEASKAGELSRRGNEKAFQGDWSNMIMGVNQILDAILQPIQEAAGVLDRVATRDMTARVKGDYRGDHAKIKESLNLAVDNLDQALGQVADATGQVASASQQISAGSQSLAQGANEQASSLEEVSSSLEEMASMTRQNADNAIQAKNLSGEANDSAKVGAEAMNRMSSSINKIKESSDQTAKIVKTIDEIAMQTNLLALNAAVEAARAGEAGRGFAVVAEEVRNLAQRSAQAAKNTADMIGESVKNADDGVKIAVEVSKSFELIATGARKVNDLIAEIAAASKEQSQGIEQVAGAVSQMDKLTQQNAANAEESSSAAEELSSQSEELQAMVNQFQITGGGAKTTRSALTHHVKPVVPSREKKISPPKVTRKVSAEDMIPLNDDALKEF